jgi:vacuolar-type H+-ATPase subunit I/STV1
MTWYNPLSWFTAAETEVKKIGEEAAEAVISLETEADNLVTDFQSFATASAKELAAIKARLEADIAKKQVALTAVNGELTKAQSVVPAAFVPTEPVPQASTPPEQPAVQQ